MSVEFPTIPIAVAATTNVSFTLGQLEKSMSDKELIETLVAETAKPKMECVEALEDCNWDIDTARAVLVGEAPKTISSGEDRMQPSRIMVLERKVTGLEFQIAQMSLDFGVRLQELLEKIESVKANEFSNK